jgi:hypothetical protein
VVQRVARDGVGDVRRARVVTGQVIRDSRGWRSPWSLNDGRRISAIAHTRRVCTLCRCAGVSFSRGERGAVLRCSTGSVLLRCRVVAEEWNVAGQRSAWRHAVGSGDDHQRQSWLRPPLSRSLLRMRAGLSFSVNLGRVPHHQISAGFGLN